MTTYVYETVPRQPGEEPKRYEIRQAMGDAALTTHPDTGEPIRRIILGGLGVLGISRTSAEETNSGGCGPGCCCQ